MLPVVPELPYVPPAWHQGHSQIWRGGSCLTPSLHPHFPGSYPRPGAGMAWSLRPRRSLCLILIGPAEMLMISKVVQLAESGCCYGCCAAQKRIPPLWPASQGGALLAKASSRALSLGPISQAAWLSYPFTFPPACSYCGNPRQTWSHGLLRLKTREPPPLRGPTGL